MARSLTKLINKAKKFELLHDYERIFYELKGRLTTTPFLVLPTPEKKYKAFCDVLQQGLGYVLMQEGKVLAYASRQLKLH